MVSRPCESTVTHRPAALFRGCPRNIVAAIFRADSAYLAWKPITPYFTGVFIGLLYCAVSWHAHCNRDVTMKNETDLTKDVESQPALGSDWVDAHADYLF